jgi:ATP-binding cassette subfamily C protein EexD
LLVLYGMSKNFKPVSDRPWSAPAGLANQRIAIANRAVAAPPTLLTVRLDHVDIAQWPAQKLGPWMDYVPQDV